MSSKELGQIHTVNTKLQLPAGDGGVSFELGDIDCPAELSQQLQQMVRQGNFFKIVGIDMSIDLDAVDDKDVYIQGVFRYYAPTRGRCAAYRGAFKAMADQMKNQGISMRDNHLYDFRAPINNVHAASFRNQATLDGTNGLALRNDATAAASIFGVHNASVQPVSTTPVGDLYAEGFSTLLSPAGTDFVLNDTRLYTGNEMIASEQYEEIPFQLEMSSVHGQSVTATFQWRPDPALYLAVMCGQFQIYVEDYRVDPQIPITQLPQLNVAVMCSGWKSIMGNPDKKRSSKKRASRKGRK
jgi:hypothetical protein